MSTKPPETNPLKWLKPSALIIEEGFNVRDKKQFAANTKELVAQIEATGYIDPSIHVVQYVERDGKKIVRGGHTLLEAARELRKQVPAMRVEMDAKRELFNLVTSNSGHPLDRYEQGRVYVRARDGQLNDGRYVCDIPAKERDAAIVEIGYILEPQPLKEIAAAVGYSLQHILDCILLNEQPEEIQQMILAGEVSPNAIALAWKGVKKESVAIKILQAAYNEAAKGVEDGKPVRATEKHVKIVKDQFVEPKKLKAARASEPETPVESSNGDGGHEETPEPETRSHAAAGTSSEPSEREPELLSREPQSAKSKKTVHELIVGILNFVSDERGLDLDDADTGAIADALIANNVPF